MFKITNYWRNTNQTYNEVSPHTGQKWLLLKSLQITSAVEGVEKGEPSNTVDGNVIGRATMENHTEVPQ